MPRELSAEPQREQERRPENFITAYYMRHGESSSDKNDPLRGLTDKGIEQVRKAVERVASEIPDKNSQIRLYSSGSERTRQQCIVAAAVLRDANFTNITIDANSLPEKRAELTGKGVRFTKILSGDELKEAQAATIAQLGLRQEGPGIGKRIAELKAPKEYPTKLRGLEADTGISAVVHWLTDKEVPAGAESRAQKAATVAKAVEIANRWAEHMRRAAEKGKEVKPMVALAFGHSSALTAYGADVFGWQGEELAEVENAEGLKIDFSGIADETPRIQPFGEKIEAKVNPIG
ncbi:MAG: phosphoglycerate mutase family protein [Candidatus Magasanikbacteria bacterium]|nr:phosphoglycerate mutase family protein [Candidatus Magasanikbacteria bacterium]